MDKVILGIGNPGQKYSKTRHNIGFLVLDEMVKFYNSKFESSKWKSLVSKLSIEGNQVLLVKPLTYVNLSGESASAVLNWYKLPPSSLLVVTDDLYLPTGKLRFRPKGGSGGHNGIKSILNHLKTEHFHRLRIGIGENNREEKASYVLSKFSKDEEVQISDAVIKSREAIVSWIADGIDQTMNKYNVKEK